MYYDLTRCVFNSTEVKDFEYVRSWYCNKLEFIRFDSSVGKFVGYTELGVKNAERLNKDQGQLAALRAQKETYCKHNIDIDYSSVLSKSGECAVCMTSSLSSWSASH